VLPTGALQRYSYGMVSVSRFIVFLSPFAVIPAAAADIVAKKEPTGGHVVTISGTLSRGDGSKVQKLFEDALKNGERVTTLVLNSGGGSSDDGLTIARLVAAAQVTTVVPARGVCSSACFIPWAAGVVRKAERGACIGVHSAAQTISHSNVETPYAKVRTIDFARIANKYGTPASIVGQMVLTNHKAMYWLNAADIASMAQSSSPEAAVPSASAPDSLETGHAATRQHAQDGSAPHSKEEEAWEAVRDSRNLLLLYRFVRAYPRSSHVAQAHQMCYFLRQEEMLTTNEHCRRHLPVWNQPQ
jgi:hypothetical protein